MLNKLKGIRFQYMRTALYIIYFSLLIIALVLFFTYSVMEPAWLSIQAIFLFVTSVVLIMTPIGLYVMYRKTGEIKTHQQAYSTFLSLLSKGHYDAKLLLKENGDEFDTLSRELNDVAIKMSKQVKSLERLAEERSEYAQQAHMAATIEERQRIARDLHDAVSQQLFALSMMSQATVKQMDKNPVQAKSQIEEIAHMALQAQNEMRALLLHLRPIQLSDEPLHQGITNLIEELKKKCNMLFELDIDEELGISQTKEEHIFRLVQEALSNILRHANADRTTLQIKNRGQIIIHINDDGEGFDVEQQIDSKASYGLKTMQERCEEIGGTFKIKSKVGEGTYIDIRIPK
ncbi:sensor histidine kinase [Halalkalibacillus halophilus]|uniref:sensor histidine kinase n=1 Tax=Halalkalibacillus halophilus TaxID=392827 RepID=UPI0004002C17|nr:sensor histidine kinase [Halalkalibacillus halophilus]